MPESRSSRADKMSGFNKDTKEWFRFKSKRYIKKFYGRKRRMLLKNKKFFDKI
jgi:hypothetical protein